MRRWSIKLFSLFGIRLEVHASFFLLLGVIVWIGYDEAGPAGITGALLYTLFIFTSVLLHEYGHCFAARRYGVRIPRILLLPFGGMAQFSHIPREPARELIITIAGPLVNFVIAGVLYVFVGWPQGLFESAFNLSLRDLLSLLMVWNIIMGVFNLLPIYPMDGGRILRALLAMRLDYLSATRWAVHIGKALAVVGIALAIFYLESPFAVALFTFVLIGGEMEYRQLREREACAGLAIADVTEPANWEEIFPFSDRTPVLQAAWPLQFYIRQFNAEGSRIYPVFAGDTFIGVVRTANFGRSLNAAQARRKGRQPNTRTASPPRKSQPPVLPRD